MSRAATFWKASPHLSASLETWLFPNWAESCCSGGWAALESACGRFGWGAGNSAPLWSLRAPPFKVKAASGGRGSAPRPRQGPSTPGPRFGALQVFVEKIPSCDNPAVPAQTISEGGIASTFARYTPKRRDFQ